MLAQGFLRFFGRARPFLESCAAAKASAADRRQRSAGQAHLLLRAVCVFAVLRIRFERKVVLPLYQALYRKWRPKTFEDVVGQGHITETLKRQVAEGRLSHAYLFTGTRGTGKTTCAKILAKAVNCEQPENGNPCNRCPSCLGIESGGFLDVLELDAASNNGVEQIRALRDEAVYAPANVKSAYTLWTKCICSLLLRSMRC